MATDIVGSLFGATPESIDAARQQQMREQAMAFAQLTPQQQVTYGSALAGQQFGRNIGGLLGAEDPMLVLARKRQELLVGTDFNDPESLLAKSRQALNIGDVQGSSALATRAMDLKKAIADQAKTSADTQKALADVTKTQSDVAKTMVDLQATTSAVQTLTSMGIDKDKALAIAKDSKLLETYLTPTTQKAFELGKTGKFTPESLATYAQSGNLSDLVEIDKMTKPTSDWLGAARALRIDAKPRYADYTPEEAARINQYLLNKDVAKNAAMRPPAQETAFAKTRGELQAKALQDAVTNAQAAQSSLVALGNMEQLASSGKLYSGPLAMTAMGASNFLNSIGLLGTEQSRLLANSEVYDKKAKDLVMQELNGRLGAQISDADRKFIEARVPQLTNSPIARAELIQKMKEIQSGKINAYQKMNTHANQFGQLNDFDFSQNYMPIQAAQSPLATPGGGTGNTTPSGNVVNFGDLKKK